ncbi:MAG: hypothetical protein J6Z33_00235, partial [Lachnospiraceae bacterium]|nr:hypothetical protein [Lachnospiraceae bacterium]
MAALFGLSFACGIGTMFFRAVCHWGRFFLARFAAWQKHAKKNRPQWHTKEVRHVDDQAYF